MMASSSANSRIFFFGSSGSAWAGSGCPKRHDIDKTGDAAQKENERSSEGRSIGYGQGTLEEGAGRRQERALRRRLCLEGEGGSLFSTRPNDLSG